jgi:hypothetical protein
MKKTALIFVLVSILSACKKDLTSLNVNPKNPSAVPSYSLFTESERLLTNTVTSASVDLNIFRLIEQQWTETTYLNETDYQLNYRRQPDAIWNALYTGVLYNLEKAKGYIPADVKDAATQKNEIAIADILQVYAYYYLVTTYGNIPYTQALNINNPFPAYDDQKTVYYALLTRLDADITALNVSGGSYGNADIIGAYNGDPGKWKIFANTLKLKMGIAIADYDNPQAKTTVEAAVAAGVFTSNSDNATLNYQSTPPNTNPVWVDLVQSQRHDFVGTTQFMNLLNPNTPTPDPRLPYFFAENSQGMYVGADNGSGSGGLVYSKYSLPSGPLLTPGSGPQAKSIGSLTNPDFPGDLLDYSETEFNLAEAAARGYNVGGTAETHYDNAITASITYWGGTDAQAAAYLFQPNAAYATAPGSTPLQKIAGQEYIALYNRGWDAWTLTRRLGYPVLTPPANAYSAFPIRFTYPISEQNVNVVNYNKAAAAIGGDLVTTKLFFIK